MNDPSYDKDSVPSVIANYRKRQERAMRLLLAFWIGIMLLILAAGYLIYRFLNAKNSPLAQNMTETPTASQVANQDTPTIVTTPAPTSGTTPPDEVVIPAQSPVPTEPSTMAYTVKEGDTFISIAVQFGVTLPTLTALNPLVTPDLLSVGDTLSIPAQGEIQATGTPAAAGSQSVIEYVVVSGDTLAAIAARFGTTIDTVVRENNLASADEIRVGQTLRIPADAGAIQSATAAIETSTAP